MFYLFQHLSPNRPVQVPDPSLLEATKGRYWQRTLAADTARPIGGRLQRSNGGFFQDLLMEPPWLVLLDFHIAHGVEWCYKQVLKKGSHRWLPTATCNSVAETGRPINQTNRTNELKTKEPSNRPTHHKLTNKAAKKGSGLWNNRMAQAQCSPG